MAPDRGQTTLSAGSTQYEAIDTLDSRSRSRSPRYPDDSPLAHVLTENEGDDDDAAPLHSKKSAQATFLALRASQPQNFTIRSVVVGLVIGTIICLSNTYFGLQTGWISGMAMPASLISFAYFKLVSRYLKLPFTPVENVLVQTVAGAVGTMPLGVGLVGVLPALEFLLEEKEGGPLSISLGRLILWSVGVCFFGVFVAFPLRKEVLVKEKLKFPSGTATALIIAVLHGDQEAIENKENHDGDGGGQSRRQSATAKLQDEEDGRDDWKKRVRLLLLAFGISGVYTLVSYFIPQIHSVPILGTYLAGTWEWTLNPSPAYAGQGIIMGTATTLHMLLGAILGWGILSPLAKNQGWAPGDVGDWKYGSQGWIVWVSLAIMLADALVNLGWLVIRPVIYHGLSYARSLLEDYRNGNLTSKSFLTLEPSKGQYSRLDRNSHSVSRAKANHAHTSQSSDEADAPPEHLPSNYIVYGGLAVSIVICIAATQLAFPSLIPLYATTLSIVFALLLSVMGVRALGETDLNPVSGISKLTQLIFATVLPRTPSSIPANLLAGAISESAALQAGDMMQDLKAGHIIGASPRAQFYGMMIGSGFGSVIAACVYKLYTSVYKIPNSLFKVPAAHVWISTARLVNGEGLPTNAPQAAAIAGAFWALFTVLRIRGQGKWWQAYIPGGIAVAVGMYNTPSFTLARTVGGLVAGWWKWKGRPEEVIIVLASGLILGEGVGSIAHLLLASLKVPHL